MEQSPALGKIAWDEEATQSPRLKSRSCALLKKRGTETRQLKVACRPGPVKRTHVSPRVVSERVYVRCVRINSLYMRALLRACVHYFSTNPL